MSYILIAIISHLITGVANVIDKVVVEKYLKAASIYAFWVSALTIVAIVLIPFGVTWPGLSMMVLSIIFGAFFIGGFFMMNAGLLRGETSRVITTIGGSLPIFTLTLSYIFLNEVLKSNQYLAFVILVLGIILMGVQKKEKNVKDHNSILFAIGAGLFFAASFVGSKYIFNNLTFISGFFWMRVGGFLCAPLILLVPKWRGEIIADIKQPGVDQKTAKGLAFINQVIGGIGFIFLNYAISIGTPTIVNALQGVQYGFIFLATAVLGNKIPTLKEKLTKSIIIQKIIAILFIVVGLILL